MAATSAEIQRLALNSVQCAVLDGGDVAIVRLNGRGSFLNSMPFKQFADQLAKHSHPREFIVDLAECETMDSTFLGVLAAISIAQERAGRPRVVVLNASDHVVRLLKTLGLLRLVDTEGGAGNQAAARAMDSDFKPAAESGATRDERVSHALEAHRLLCEVETENKARFQSVIQSLEDSLKKEPPTS